MLAMLFGGAHSLRKSGLGYKSILEASLHHNSIGEILFPRPKRFADFAFYFRRPGSFLSLDVLSITRLWGGFIASPEYI